MAFGAAFDVPRTGVHEAHLTMAVAPRAEVESVIHSVRLLEQMGTRSRTPVT
jgi:hypothetical protein